MKYLISPPSSTQSLITNFHLIHISPLGTVYFGVLHFFRANMLIIITVLFFQNAFPPKHRKEYYSGLTLRYLRSVGQTEAE